MAERDSLHAFAGKMTTAAATMKAVGPKAVTAGSLVLTTAVRAEIASKTRGGILRGVGRNGAKVGAKFSVAGNTGYVRATGPLHLLERDNKPHIMEAKPGKLYRIPGGGKNGKGIAVPVVHHPGSKGKHPFEKGVIAGRPAAEKAMAEVVTKAVATSLR